MVRQKEIDIIKKRKISDEEKKENLEEAVHTDIKGIAGALSETLGVSESDVYAEIIYRATLLHRESKN